MIGTLARSRASTQEYFATPHLVRLCEVAIRKAHMMEGVALIAIGFILAAGACLRSLLSAMTAIVE